MPPVFKTGESRVSPGSGRFDSDTLPPDSYVNGVFPKPHLSDGNFAYLAWF